MYKQPLYKKLSLGIAFIDINANQIIEVLHKYKDYMHDIYFSPVEDIAFQSGRAIYDFTNTNLTERQRELSKILYFAKQNNIALTLTLNSLKATEKDMLYMFDYYNKLYNIDYVTTFLPTAKLIKQQYPDKKIICSFNEGVNNMKKLMEIIDSNVFSCIVLGMSFIRNFEAFKLIKDNNIKIKLLVNNACHLNCEVFCRDRELCKKAFEKSELEIGATQLYAETSLFPEELFKYYIPNDIIDIYKLSSRPLGYYGLNDLLESYINNDSKKYIKASFRNYHLYGRLAHFGEYSQQFDYDEIMSIKQKIWDRILM